MKRILSLFTATIIAFGMLTVLPVMAATDQTIDESESESVTVEMAGSENGYIISTGNPIYSESFDDKTQDEIKTIINGQQDGWKIDGTHFSLDVGNGFSTGSQAIRFSNVEWGKNNSLALDFVDSAEAKGIDADKFSALTSDKVAFNFQYGFDADFGGFQSGSTSRLQFLDKDGNVFMAFEAYTKDKATEDISLNLIALNSEKNQNVRYELARGKNNVFKLIKTVQLYLDPTINSYKLNINGKDVSIGDHGDWIPASSSDELGAANQSTSLSLGGIKIDNKDSNWYGGAILDSMAISSWDKLEFSGKAEAPLEPMSMWYRMPAQLWAQSLPLGNGRIGSMIWGNVDMDTVSLNDVTAWSGQASEGLDKDNNSPIQKQAIKDLQDELMRENPDYNLLNEMLKSIGGTSTPTFGTHRPFGKLAFDHEMSSNQIANYKRSLDLPTGVSYVDYSMDGVDYSREAFVSNPDDVMVMKYSASQGGNITFDVNFDTEETNGGTGTTTANDAEGYIEWNGAVYNNDNVTDGVNTFAYLKAIPTGGSVTYDENGIHVNSADEVVLVLSLGTDFNTGINFPENSKENCKAILDSAIAKDYSTLKTDHVNDVSPFFNRMKVEIGAESELRAADPVDVRLNAIRAGKDIDGSFMSLWYQYARYLMIAGSRENSPMPMNLQGIWNDNVAANMAWTCDYHLDINIEMNQWMSTSSNLAESEKPIFKFLKNILIPNGKITASKQYASVGNPEIGMGPGWVSSITTNAFGYTGNDGGVGAWHGNTTCGAWLVQEVMNYFDSTNDMIFLEEEGLPILKDTADFYLNFMVQYTDKEGNTYWVTAPSSSPEHGNIEMMSTMEVTVISDIFTQVLRSYDILGMEHDAYYDAVKEKLDNMYGYKIQPTGNLAEWPFNKNDDGNTAHRHTSHLLGLFPYSQITPDKTPELAKASLVSMQRRFDRSDFEHTEWTAVNAQGQYARLKDSENAYKYLKLQGDTFTWPNLLSISPEGIALAPCDVYIIDGTFGVGEATADMLLQGHSDRLEFLPALPKQWQEGNIEGMTAEGAFEVDFSWEDYTIKSAEILSKAGNKCSVYKNAAMNWQNIGVYKKSGDTLTEVSFDNGASLISFDTEAGETYAIMAKNEQKLQTGRLINDTDSRIRYSGFNANGPRPGLGDYYSDAHYAEGENSTIEFDFSGTGIDVLAATGTDGSAFEVFIDGETKGQYTTLVGDSYNPQQVVYSVDDLANMDHTIKIVKKTGQFLVFDAFAIRGQYFSYINDDNPMITYGDGWSRGTDRLEDGNGTPFNDYLGDIHYCTEVGKTLEVNFDGTGIEALVEKNSAYGSLEFEIDGVKSAAINTGDAPHSDREGASNVWQSQKLSNGSHTLKITNIGGGWNWAAIDGFIILNEGGTAFNTGLYQISNLNTSQILDSDEYGLKHTSDLTGGPNQKWSIEYVDDNYFRLISPYNGMAVSLGSNHADAIMEPVNYLDDEQLFQFIPYSGDTSKSHIMGKTTGEFLQINGGEDVTYNGGSVGLYPIDQWPKKHFRWTAESVGNNLITLKNDVGTYFTIDPSLPNSEGARILTWQKLVGSEQFWNLQVSDDGNGFTITSNKSGKQIAENNGNIVLVNAGEGSNKWNITEAKLEGKTYYTLINVDSGATLSLDDNTQWQLSVASVEKALPYVYDISAPSSINNGQPINITYKYGSIIGEAETESNWEAYVLDAKDSALVDPIETGVATAESGFTFTPSGFDPYKVLAIKVTPKTGSKTGTSFVKFITTKASISENLSETVTIVEDFSENGYIDAIKAKTKGWYHGGDKYSLGIADKSPNTNSLYISANDWWSSPYMGVKLSDTANDFEPLSGKAYFEFDAMFDAPNNFNIDSKVYFSLKNDTSKFVTVRLNGKKLEMITMGSTGNFTKSYTIDCGVENTYGKWFNFKFYIDTESNLFAVKINNDYFLNDEGGIWFRPASDSSETKSNITETTIGSLTDIELGHFWMSQTSSLYTDNWKMGTYDALDGDNWTINYVDTDDGSLYYDEYNNITVNVTNNDSDGANESGDVLVGLYDAEGVLIDSEVFEDVVFDSRNIFEETISMYVPRIGGKYTLSAYVWNSETMAPMGKAVKNIKTVKSRFNLPTVFSDNMMLQADKPATIWGEAVADDEITAELLNVDTNVSVIGSSVADENGKWELELPAQVAGGNYTLTVINDVERIEYTNIIFGDVYLLGGQSNMEYWMDGLADTKQDLKDNSERANNPNIRSVDLLSRGTDGAPNPVEDLPDNGDTTWREMTAGEAGRASQIGYYFAQQLNEETGRPIGFISAAVGGSPIADWLADGSGKLYNNRVYPCRNFEISGVLFYQGESDENRTADDYSNIFAKVIDDYRILFENETMPFYYAQLARFSNQDFRNIYAAQIWVLDKVSNKTNVGIISTLDEYGTKASGSGNARGDIHPYGKKDIASKFAQYAKYDIYKMADYARGPMFKSMTTDGDKLIVTYDCTGDLKIMDPDQYGDNQTISNINAGGINPDILNEFEIAGSDGVYKTATATIEGNKVILTSAEVASPQNVRYAFKKYAESPNLTDDSNMSSYIFSSEYMK